jgi:hypothetical protein
LSHIDPAGTTLTDRRLTVPDGKPQVTIESLIAKAEARVKAMSAQDQHDDEDADQDGEKAWSQRQVIDLTHCVQVVLRRRLSVSFCPGIGS